MGQVQDIRIECRGLNNIVCCTYCVDLPRYDFEVRPVCLPLPPSHCDRCAFWKQCSVLVNSIMNKRNIRSLRIHNVPSYTPEVGADCNKIDERLIGLTGLQGLSCLEVFEMQLDWNYSSPAIPRLLPKARLKLLNVPLHQMSDCSDLAHWLKETHRLRSLTVRDIVDDRDSFEALRWLGVGIFERRETLEHLRLELANYKRETLSKDPIFATTTKFGIHLYAIFPWLVPERKDLEGNYPLKVRDFLSMVEYDRLVKIRSLELKNFELPWRAFRKVFDPQVLKCLALPGTQVDPQVWKGLAELSNLVSLEGVQYDALKDSFQPMFDRQLGLRRLSFQRPRDIYVQRKRFQKHGLNLPLVEHELIRSQPELGPANASQYYEYLPIDANEKDIDLYLQGPHIMTSISKLLQLEYLSIPGDMLDVDEYAIECIGHCQRLQELEICFDYKDKVISSPLMIYWRRDLLVNPENTSSQTVNRHTYSRNANCEYLSISLNNEERANTSYSSRSAKISSASSTSFLDFTNLLSPPPFDRTKSSTPWTCLGISKQTLPLRPAIWNGCVICPQQE